jgi:hypothetical protein
MKKQLLTLVILSLSLMGCIEPKRITVPFDEKSFAIYKQKGTATVQGQAFLKTAGGDVKYGAGNQIMLLPYNDYVKEVKTLKTARHIQLANEDLRWQDYSKSTISDAQGKFEFKNIPAGEYLLETEITWGVPSQFGLQQTGGVVRKPFKITDGEVANIMLTE